MKENNITAPVISYSRLRMETDGKGVTTLVCFHGCPLRCKYCLNPFSFKDETKREYVSPKSLYDSLKIDQLYFLATGGGVTFGGGEPLLYPRFIKEFCECCGKDWHICAETSLNVPEENVRIASECVDKFYVDCKDTNPVIYKNYTCRDNKKMLDNLALLLSLVGADRIMVRVPLIPDYNTEEDRKNSVELLLSMGITNLDLFKYKK
ncbi:MAG: radical SAM protein [Ruminococcaceae bacterium]|nr:radical SAM protein [Oscillospiraceae bacterium]